MSQYKRPDPLQKPENALPDEFPGFETPTPVQPRPVGKKYYPLLGAPLVMDSPNPKLRLITDMDYDKYYVMPYRDQNLVYLRSGERSARVIEEFDMDRYY